MAAEVGVLKPLAKKPKLAKKWAPRKGGGRKIILVRGPKTIVEVARFHEWGGVNDKGHQVPARSFMRSTFHEQRRNLRAIFKSRIERRIKGKKSLKIHNILDEVGDWFAWKIKAKFRDNDWAPLSDPTREGKNTRAKGIPLIDTGELRKSMTHRVVKIGKRQKKENHEP